MLALATMFSVTVGAAGERFGLDRTLRANTERENALTHCCVKPMSTWPAWLARSSSTSGERSMCCGVSYAQLIESTHLFEGMPEIEYSRLF